MKAWEAMEVNKLYNMLDAIMFCYTYRGVVRCMADIHSTGMRGVYLRVEREIVAADRKLEKSRHVLADYCAKASKRTQRVLLRTLDI